jgi:hypothetical protein
MCSNTDWLEDHEYQVQGGLYRVCLIGTDYVTLAMNKRFQSPLYEISSRCCQCTTLGLIHALA